MARGIEAKQYIINKLKEAFGTDYLGENGGKYYVAAPDGDARVQMAIAITCPAKEVAFTTPTTATADRDGGAFSLNSAPPPAPNSSALGSGEMSEEEVDRIKKLLEELGL